MCSIFFQLTLFPHIYFLLWQKDASRQTLKLHLQVQGFRGIRIRDANTDSSLMPGSWNMALASLCLIFAACSVVNFIW